MRPAGCPLHLLLLHHAFADHLVHRRFNEGRADRLAGSVANSSPPARQGGMTACPYARIFGGAI
jgi:hypothetical protein